MCVCKRVDLLRVKGQSALWFQFSTVGLCTRLPLLVTFSNDFSFLLLEKENCLCFMEKTRYRNRYGQLLFILKKREWERGKGEGKGL